MTNEAMNAIIRRGLWVTRPSVRRKVADTDDRGLGEQVVADADQGRRTIAAAPSMSVLIDDHIRRAAGMSVRPGHHPVPEVGY